MHKRLGKLTQRRTRLSTGQFLAEGPQAVSEALGSQGIVDALVVNGVDVLARVGSIPGSVPIYLATDDELSTLTSTVTSQGVVAVCRWQQQTLAEISKPTLVVVCAHIRDPGNAGTVIRCADAFGADLVVMTDGSVEVTNPKVVRASVGSIFHLPIVTDVSVPEVSAWLGQQQCQQLAADGGGESLDELIRDRSLASPTAWWMGNEAWGITDEVRAAVDRVVAVPMWGRAESLNLATAAAICLFETGRAQQ